MDLLEVDGKALLRRHGIPVPAGGLWPDPQPADRPYVVKAQVPAGKRGKSGGIRFAGSWDEADALARDLLDGRIAGLPVKHVLVEERLAIARELYVSVLLDRDAGCLTMLASPEGGMDIEEIGSERLLRLRIDPLLGLRGFHGDAVARFLDPEGALAGQLQKVVRALYDLARKEEATLVEINPLVVTTTGEVIAVDAKVSLDDNARRRHPEWNDFRSPDIRTPFERAVAEAGAVGVEIDPEGDVLAVISGAGLMMATLDLLAGAGHRVRGVVDLGGAVLAGGEVLARVLRAVVSVRPRITFVNAFMQTALCDEFARVLAQAHEMAPLEGRVVVRLKGRNAGPAHRILAGCGFEIEEDLAPALERLNSRHRPVEA